MGESLDLSAEATSIERLNRIDDSRVKFTPMLLQQATVGDLVRERVLERVLDVRDEPRLVQKLAFPKPVEARTEHFLRQIRHCPQQHEGHFLADHGCRLQERLVFRRKAIDARREHRLDGGGHAELAGGLHEPIVTTFADEHARLDQRPHALFQEERVAASAIDQNRLEPARGDFMTDQAIEKGASILDREGIDANLSVTTPIAPRVLVLGPIADEKQHTMAREAVDQGVEHGLRRRVDPVEILDDEDHRLAATLLEDQELDCLQRSSPFLRWVERRPFRVVGR